MENELKLNKLNIKIIKLIIEGLAVAIIALILPTKMKLTILEAVTLGLVASCVLALLETISPMITN
jgi:DNA integrity scanning protein DisA with diadenylate cyclase activity